MQQKNKYREFCGRETSIPIFSRDWWLDAVCGEDNWDVVVVEKAGQIQACMPYYMPKRGVIIMPLLTQTIGPWLRPSKAKYAKQLAEQKDLMTELIEKLPPFDRFQQNFHYSITNWLPFFWKGFQQTTRYTYVLDGLKDMDKVWKEFMDNIRSDIRKAKKNKVVVRTDCGLDAFLNVNEMTFKRQGRPLPYSREFITKLDAVCEMQKARQIYVTEDSQGRVHAAAYIVWDDNSAYYLMGGGDPELRNSGATSLIMWEAIQFASTVSDKFDFEGSMIEPIERYFRAFGARQVPYCAVSKNNSRILMAVEAARMFKRAIL